MAWDDEEFGWFEDWSRIDQEETDPRCWITRDKRKIPITDMTTDHLQNTIAMLQKRPSTFWERHFINAMTLELQARGCRVGTYRLDSYALDDVTDFIGWERLVVALAHLAVAVREEDTLKRYFLLEVE